MSLKLVSVFWLRRNIWWPSSCICEEPCMLCEPNASWFTFCMSLLVATQVAFSPGSLMWHHAWSVRVNLPSIVAVNHGQFQYYFPSLHTFLLCFLVTVAFRPSKIKLFCLFLIAAPWRLSLLCPSYVPRLAGWDTLRICRQSLVVFMKSLLWLIT